MKRKQFKLSEDLNKAVEVLRKQLESYFRVPISIEIYDEDDSIIGMFSTSVLMEITIGSYKYVRMIHKAGLDRPEVSFYLIRHSANDIVYKFLSWAASRM